MNDGLIIINKPAGYTSHDIVNIVRKTLHTKKVGHAGTLDPDATGVLVVAVNKATKALQFLTAENKEYIATLKLGIATDTMDASGTIQEEKPFTGYTDLKEVLDSFLGDSMQVPPIYSAIKIN
ncbi:MAG: pseudouridine synthase, partial [Sharpea porci]